VVRRTADLSSDTPPAMGGGRMGENRRVLSEEQIRRYSRQLILPEVGGNGQRKLLNGKVLLVGAGGLGSPAALYLAAAGVGTLGIVDLMWSTSAICSARYCIMFATWDVPRWNPQWIRSRT